MLQIEIRDHDVGRDSTLPLGRSSPTHSPKQTLGAQEPPPSRTQLGGGHMDQVDGHTGMYAKSEGEATQGGEGATP